MDASRQIQDSRQLETDLHQSLHSATANVEELKARCDDLEQQLKQETQTREFLSVEFYKADGMSGHYGIIVSVNSVILMQVDEALCHKSQPLKQSLKDDISVALGSKKCT